VNVIHESGLEEVEPEAGGAKIIDIMSVLRKSLSKNAVVTNAKGAQPIDLAERRTRKNVTAKKAAEKKSSTRRKASRKRV
jgi:DNA end-binding protein Ku